MTRGQLIENIRTLIERLYVHDELSASVIEQEFELNEEKLGMNGLKSKVAELEQLLEPYEVV
jgi:peptidyl-tRNA hydrolase